MTELDIEALLRPKSVAIIGASDDGTRTAGRPLRYLRRHGYKGRVYPINPRRETVQGEPAWPDLVSLPEVPDHVYIVLGTEPAITALEACAEAGVRTASILADGFAEDGPAGEARQHRVAEIAKAGGMRVLGPNSMGVIDCLGGCALSVNAALDAETLPKGRLMAISQSGSLIGTLLSRGQARGIGFSSLISVGNEAELSVGEIGLAAVGDDSVDAFLLFMETIRRPDMMAEFARAAHGVGKPVIVYKLGRSDAGRELAVSHTGALLGSDAAADAFFRDHGIVRVEQFEALFETAPLLIGRAPETERQAKPVAVVTTTGGGGAMVVDRLGASGIAVEGVTEDVRTKLAEHDISIRPGRLVDVTLAGAKYETMMTVLGTLLDSSAYAAVVAVIGSSAQFHPQLAVQSIIDSSGHDVPLAAFMVPQAEASLAALADANVPAFRTPETCADAIRALIEWRHPKPATTAPPISLPEQTGFSETEALAVFADLGVPVTERVILGAEDAIPDGLSYPVAAKILSPEIAHKTEIGGVELAVADAGALAAARDRILTAARTHAPAAQLDGVLVQPMATGLGEVLVGFARDAEAGPVVTVAPGGILAELYGDAATRTAPINAATACEMIAEVKGLAPLAGYRGLPKGDLTALAEAVAAFSQLALAAPAVSEAEINPMIVRVEGEGVIAVDGLLRLTT